MAAIDPHILMKLTSLAFSLFLALSLAGACAQQEGPGSWAFQYPANDARPGAMLDLRSLNERVAGESGFVKLTPDGSGFALGNGKPVRFWSVCSDLYRGTPEEMARHARFLAKMGVNMVRLHTQIAADVPGSKPTDVNEKEIDGIRRLVAALKKEGIYTTISPYWATERDVSGWGIAGYTGKTELWGLLFFDEALQRGYKAWVRALYAPVNPYTGIPLAKDPAVALIQVQNEDSLLFWTLQRLHPEQQERLGRRFGQWLVKRYGSLEKAKQAWQGAGHPKDDFAHGVVGLQNVYMMTQELTGGIARRVDDELRFYAETQRQFYANIARYYHDDLGCTQLVNASNWITADPIRLNDVERWTYTADDVLAVNKYTGGVHTGENNGWRIDPGHHFTNESCLTHPRNLPTNLKQVVGHPMLITESTWVSPEAYQAEGPFMAAAYMSLTGVDSLYWFAATSPEYDQNPYFDFLNLQGSQHPLHKWTCSTPSLIAQFPAAALLFRTGCLRQGEPVVHEERSLDDLWQRKIPAIAEDRSFDPNRYTGNTGAASNIRGGIDPLAFLVGPVETKYGGDPSKSRAADLARYIDRAKQVVTGVTGEVRLDYGNGLCTIDAPKAQGACGFLSKAGEVRLTDLTLRSRSDYASVTVVAMDDRPLRASRKVLVQVGSLARPTGWQAQPADFKSDDGKQTFHGFEVLNTGRPPWQVASTQVTLTVANPGLKRATLLDAAGYPARPLAAATTGGRLTLQLPPNAMYVVLE